MYLQFPGNVAAMGRDSVDAETEGIGNFFIGHTHSNAMYNLFLAFTESIQPITCHLIIFLRTDWCHYTTCQQFLLETTHHRDKQLVLYTTMLGKVGRLFRCTARTSRPTLRLHEPKRPGYRRFSEYADRGGELLFQEL